MSYPRIFERAFHAPEGGATSPPPPPPPPPPPAGGEWTTGLEKPYQELVTAKGWKAPGDVVKGYTELERLVGADKIALPGKDAKPEDWDGVYAKLGRPAKPEEYKLPAPAAGAYSDTDKAFQSKVLPMLHAAGITQRQLETIAPAWNAMAAEQVKAMDGNARATAATSAATLKGEWKDPAAYAENMDFSNRAFRQVFGDQVDDIRTMRLADGSYLGDNVLFIKAMAGLGKGLNADNKLIGDPGHGGFSGAGGMADAKRELDALLAAAAKDPKHPYVDPTNPEHAAVADKVMRLTMASVGGLEKR